MPEVLTEWARTPARIRAAIRGLGEGDLDLRGGEEGWSIRELVHHLVESNLIASNMIIAALATDEHHFDWTWVNPSKSWMKRTGYDKADIEPALAMLRGLCRHVANLVPGKLKRTVKLNDAPGEPTYVRTIEEILAQEAGHVTGHLSEVRAIREKFGK